MVDINTTLNDETWIERSRPADDLAPQFTFLLSRTVYTGDPNSLDQLRSEKYNPPISLPELGARDPLRPAAREVLGREEALAAYYREMMEMTGKRPGAGAVGYWLRLGFVSPALDLHIPFPWWDQVTEASDLFSWLRMSETGDSGFLDCDQGWVFKAKRLGERFHFLHGDLDTAEIYENVSTDRAAFLVGLDRADTEIRAVIQHLQDELQIDPWS